MEKTGQVEAEVSRCDECGDLAVIVVGQRAFCEVHKPQDGEKSAGVDPGSSHRLKSFTRPDAVFQQ